MKIKLLNNSLINKIAAGEVIERPSSVVKELLENSLDAGATSIAIEVEDGGLKKIKIIDNGYGMNENDLLLSYKRHATSKISNDNDLFNIMSLGFRGEALASISEVSNTRIQTSTNDSPIGCFVEIEAGKLISSGRCACPTGTIIEVDDLLFNVPARKKYLKSHDVEFNHILRIVTKYALIRKDVSFKLVKDGREVLNSKRNDNLLNRVVHIYGSNVAKDLIEVNYKDNDIEIYGFISKPNLTRSDRSDQSLYVNNRYVKNKIISDSIYNAYKTLLFIHRHPVFILNVKISPREIDVNVHPSKEIIRLKNEVLVSHALFNAISNSFKSSSLIPNANLEKESAGSPLKDYPFKTHFQTNLDVDKHSSDANSQYQTENDVNTGEETKSVNLSWQIQKKDIIVKESTVDYLSNTNNGYVHPNFGPFVTLGQINKSFIIAKSPQGLVIIDQHAAEERVNYEKFMKERKNNVIKKQGLLSSKIIELNPIQYMVAINNKYFIRGLGYEFEDFGDNTVKLSSVPEIFGRMRSVLFLDIINEIEKTAPQKPLPGNRETETTKTIGTEIEERIIKFACRASVKAGDELTMFEMRELLSKLSKCKNPFTCPHGRPTVINFSISDLEKKFKRK
jgi:DNA mismatch repair protein MutL